MKNSSFLINTARGKIVNEKDLGIALKKKIIAGAGLDVFESEPIGNNHLFTKISNIVLAPHIGSSSRETREEMARITVKNLNLGINGKKPIYSVGYQNLGIILRIISKKKEIKKLQFLYVNCNTESD